VKSLKIKLEKELLKEFEEMVESFNRDTNEVAVELIKKYIEEKKALISEDGLTLEEIREIEELKNNGFGEDE